MTQLAITSEQNYWTESQLSALKQLGLSNASKGDLQVFFHQAQKTGLDPFARQIYMIERGGRFGIQSSIDGLRIVAQRSGEYAGQVGPHWCGTDGVWKDVWLEATPPVAAKVGVMRVGFMEPLYAVAKWDSYAQNSPTWKKMPDLMLAKCAEALALRKAFPNDLSGIYTDDEMSQADNREPAIEVQKVDLKIVKDETRVPKHVDWDSLLPAVERLSEIDAVKKLWNARKEILDEVVPDTSYTLRELLLAKVEALNATTN